MTGVLFYHPLARPIASLVKAIPEATFNFFTTGGNIQAVVYKDAYLKYPHFGQPQADAAGNFPPIYLDPKIVYRVQLVDAFGNVQYTQDPYIPPMPGLGSGSIQSNPTTGEVQINGSVPIGGGVGTTLTVGRNVGQAIAISGNFFAPNDPMFQFINTLTVGTQAAAFAAQNKPGALTNQFPSVWLPILGDGGVLYCIPLWA